MKLVVLKIFFIVPLTLLFMASVWAQSEAPKELDRQLEQQQEAEALAETDEPVINAPKSSKTKPPKKTFKPSEEISEDSPVPFPVDI
jgi:hypothetical protein